MVTATDLENMGIEGVEEVYYNLSYDELKKHELDPSLSGYEKVYITDLGAATCDTGVFTGRSPKDKYFVDRAPSNENIAWGKINQKIDESIFNRLEKVAKKELSNKKLYVMDLFTGSSDASKRKVRFITEVAWQAHFVKNMFIRPTEEELKDFEPDFTVLNAAKAVNEDWEKIKF